MAEEKLPEYFKQYLEQKFKELQDKIDTVMDNHKLEMNQINIRMDKFEKKQNWANGKIILAMGAISVIGIAGFVFSLYFKTLNRQQIEDALTNKTPEISKQVVLDIENKYDLKIDKR